jgi:3alpha(or 20beta)-hydroxysteroid dehydrogenase
MLAGRAAVVTGGAGDVGRSVAARLLRDGARVALIDIDEVGLKDAAAQLDVDDRVLTVTADTTDEDSVREAFAQVATWAGGRIDVLINNAGVEGPVAPITDVAVDDLVRVLQVNVVGVFLGLKHGLPHMEAGGVVVNTGSTASLRGAPNVAPYVASKHAVLGLTRSASLEMAGRGIRVCAVCPGPLEGRMIRELDERRRALGHEPGDVRRYGQVEDVANAVAYLVSDEARFVNGTGLVIDGGRLA